MSTACPNLASLLTSGQPITHRHHTRGWLETPDGRHVQPDASQVRFINGFNAPFINRPRSPRWFARLMGIFA